MRLLNSMKNLCFLFGSSVALSVNAQTMIKMQIGDIKVLAIEQIARVAVGDSKVLNANTDDDKELVLFARAEGQTTLEVWNAEGKRQSYVVDIRSAKAREIKEDIRRMLNKIPNVKTTIVGEKIIVEGDHLSDADRERVLKLSSHYPQIVDMSSQVGWDDMVMIDVQILELPRHYIQQLGVKWDGQSKGGFSFGGAIEANSPELLARPGEMVMATALGGKAVYAGFNTLLSSSIQAMASQGKAVILAQPQLMARSGAMAEFLAGGEVPYSVADSNGNTQTVFKPYGVSLYITPRIEKNGIIRSKINVEVSAVDSSLSFNGGPALKTRRTSTEFNVKSGEPLVLSGFISRDQMQGMERLPGMSDLPILGELFRSRKFQQNETEMVIIVRPMLMSSKNTQMQTRVKRSQAIIDSSFENGPLLNVPLVSDNVDSSQGKRILLKEENTRINSSRVSAEVHSLSPKGAISINKAEVVDENTLKKVQSALSKKKVLMQQEYDEEDLKRVQTALFKKKTLMQDRYDEKALKKVQAVLFQKKMFIQEEYDEEALKKAQTALFKKVIAEEWVLDKQLLSQHAKFSVLKKTPKIVAIKKKQPQ